MSLKIRKRDGVDKDFDYTKIQHAIERANLSVSLKDRMPTELAISIGKKIQEFYNNHDTMPNVEDVQDKVITEIMELGYYKLAINYTTYRYQHALSRKENSIDKKILAIVGGISSEAKEENSNKNPDIIATQRDYIAGEVSRDMTRRYILPPDIMRAHDEGLIHFHDSDYSINHSYNCCLVNLDDMLQNGTVITDTLIERPHSFKTACNIATQIIAQVASNQYGGQSISLTHLAKFVDVSRKSIRTDIIEEHKKLNIDISTSEIDKITDMRLRKEISSGIQTIQYQVLTLMTTNGQAPFITLFMYLGEAEDETLKNDLAICIEEVLNQRIHGVKNEKGIWVTPSFPKLIYALEEDNIHEDSKYWYLTELAAKCSAKRMVPDYISAKKMKELKGDVYTCMGCRSFLTPDRFTDKYKTNMSNASNWNPSKHKYYGRFNQGVVTINLPFVAMKSNRNVDEFWKLFEEDLELCHRALRIRHEGLLGTVSDVAPISWRYGALARLEKGEKIDRLLFDGYSTISLGYAGLYEAVMYMTGYSHTDPNGKEFALQIMQKMNDKTTEWKAAENIDYSLYGTPIESTTYKFAKALKTKFGIVENVSDHEYITNSYHVNVREEIDAFEKLKFESEFQHMSPGGAISYVEVPDMSNNIPAVLSLIKFIYDNIIYAELNTKSDYCQECGYDGEIKIVEDSGKLEWECPECGNRNQDKMNVARRTCGYIGTQFWNQGRTAEIKDRVMHL